MTTKIRTSAVLLMLLGGLMFVVGLVLTLWLLYLASEEESRSDIRCESSVGVTDGTTTMTCTSRTPATTYGPERQHGQITLTVGVTIAGALLFTAGYLKDPLEIPAAPAGQPYPPGRATPSTLPHAR
ncbi:hypothetical protein GOARA_057_00210 [Gordonia araii NBRC 100433]|uniref:Transmembrane protein n=1 Tax=Gordonia araii NBRC 100433 TaxID=1073574 RepID=G7H3S2_9ACTN|nr:hypothetical protein [Gordonia araii]NNG98681.1 hypothetical protein [Gordonia araii NBRC 100433]GAB10497.1 hypothetical protein GOARA_057_00210 [Gordonia araii NBRC 100433]